MNWLGLDIGGANIKVADAEAYAVVRPFPMWERPNQLVPMLRQLLAESPPCDHLAVTMTGELADCFADKTEGVRFIVSAVEEAAAGRHLRVYSGNGSFVTTIVAKKQPRLVAAMNWHALARFATRFAPQSNGLLVDVGSTTTDILPLSPDQLELVGRSDTERLRDKALLYTGISRSPVCAVASRVPYRDYNLPVAQELFATMRDVYLLRGNLPECPTDRDTADGQPATKSDARRRLGRTICADHEEFHHRDAAVLAEAIANDHIQLVASTLQEWVSNNKDVFVIVSGSGEFLARIALKTAGHEGETLSLARKLSSAHSVAAAAHALAVLAVESRG